MRKCRRCKSEIPPVKSSNGYQKAGFCDVDCMAAHGLAKAKQAQAKAKRADIRERKQAIKTRAQWLKELQAVVNKYVRLRDAKDGCISCDKPASWSGQWHASHYFSVGASGSLRFNLWNIHKGCSICNNHLSGNIGEYTPRLIEKIGNERYQYLVSRKAEPARYEIDYIKRAIKVAKLGIKRLEKRL